MENQEIRIEAAQRCHAPHIARAVMDAVGEEICREFAAPYHTVEDVERLFTHLASLEDSQYSYRNALVALDAAGEVAGVCVSYDGALLHGLRRRFFEAARTMLGKEMEGMADETSPDEFYLDTVAVAPGCRGRGIGSALLLAAVERAHRCGKQAGLLVDPDNPRAERLYRTLGFRPAGKRPFAGVMMKHLVLPKEEKQAGSGG